MKPNIKWSEKMRLLMVCSQTRNKDIAEHLGIEPVTLSSYLCGRTAPSLETIVEFANFFNVSTDWLLEDDAKSGTEDINKVVFAFGKMTPDQRRLVNATIQLVNDIPRNLLPDIEKAVKEISDKTKHEIGKKLTLHPK